jgi:hypothetical protein
MSTTQEERAEVRDFYVRGQKGAQAALIAGVFDDLAAAEATIANGRDAIYALTTEIANARIKEKEQAATIAELRAFKDYVHERLDAAGISTHPDGPHSAAGCRIGDRLDIVFATIAERDADIARLKEMAKEFAMETCRNLHSHYPPGETCLTANPRIAALSAASTAGEEQ